MNRIAVGFDAVLTVARARTPQPEQALRAVVELNDAYNSLSPDDQHDLHTYLTTLGSRI